MKLNLKTVLQVAAIAAVTSVAMGHLSSLRKAGN